MAVINWKDYDAAHANWVKYWANVGMLAPTLYHEFLGLDYTPTFSRLFKISVIPDEAANKINLLQGSHYGTVIIAWCVKNKHQWKRP